MGRRLKKPYNLEGLEVIDVLMNGKGLVRHEGKAIFVKGALPGDIIDIEVNRKEKGNLEGRLQNIQKRSPDREDPFCSHFADCGGCTWQNLSYEKQLFFKQKHVVDSLERIAKVECQGVMPIIGMDNPKWYRNKLDFNCGDRPWLTKDQMDAGADKNARVCGFHPSGYYSKIIDCDVCYLLKPIVNDIRKFIVNFAIEQDWGFWKIFEHSGFMRNIIFRTSEATGEIMVILLVGENNQDKIDLVFTALAKEFKQVTSFLWIFSDRVNDSYTDLPFKTWKGASFITEKLGGYSFKISPVSFFQTNPTQAERLYQAVFDMVGPKVNILYDLYCGTGSIGIFVEKLASKVVGIEYVEKAVEDARENCELNGLDKFSFYAGNMKDILTHELVEKEGSPSVIITDPPRAGMDSGVVKRILELSPDKIIYVSCKPATQARDLEMLKEKYTLTKVQAVDMFPHTFHVENIILLEKTKS